MKNKYKLGILKFSCIFICLVFVIALFLNMITVNASVTDTLTIEVGYFGGPYYEKEIYNWYELYENLDLYEEAYTYKNGERYAIDSAKGFLITDILNYSSIDLSEIANISFFTDDYSSGIEFTSFSRSSLFQQDRYYFDNLPYNSVYDNNSLWNNSKIVEPMLALEDNFKWFPAGITNAKPDFNNMTNNKFRLCFGMTSPTESGTSSQAAKWVHTLRITYSGSGSINSNNTDISDYVGNELQLDYSLDSSDEFLNKIISNEMEWTSLDDDIVTVSNTGLIKFLSKGTTQVIAKYKNSIIKYNITVNENNDETEATKETEQTNSIEANETILESQYTDNTSETKFTNISGDNNFIEGDSNGNSNSISLNETIDNNNNNNSNDGVEIKRIIDENKSFNKKVLFKIKNGVFLDNTESKDISNNNNKTNIEIKSYDFNILYLIPLIIILISFFIRYFRDTIINIFRKKE